MACIVGGLLDLISDVGEVGKNIVEGLWNGISDMTSWVIEKIQGFGSDILDGLKDFFGIASPSKVFRDQIGQWLPKGMAVGIEANADAVTSAMDDLANETLNTGANITSDFAKQNYSYSAPNVSSNDRLIDLLTEYLPIIASGQNVNVTLEGDAENLFSAIQKQNNIYRKQNGSSAFA